MLFHASIPTADPARAAQAIAAIWGGRAYPMPYIAEGSWAVLTGDDQGTMLEILPEGTEFHHRPGEHVEVRRGASMRASGFHLLSASPHPVERIVALAAMHGYPAHLAQHGPLPVVEVWIGSFLLEVIPPETQAEYRRLVTYENAEAMTRTAFGAEALAA